MIGLFYEKGVYGTDYILRIGSVEEILSQLANINDWMCLINQGRSLGPKKDQPKLDKLHDFLSDCPDRETLEKFKIKISTGELACVMCAETITELEEMRKFILKEKKFEENKKNLNLLFDRIHECISYGELNSYYCKKVSSRQYITSGIGLDDYLDE